MVIEPAEACAMPPGEVKIRLRGAEENKNTRQNTFSDWLDSRWSIDGTRSI